MNSTINLQFGDIFKEEKHNYFYITNYKNTCIFLLISHTSTDNSLHIKFIGLDIEKLPPKTNSLDLPVKHFIKKFKNIINKTRIIIDLLNNKDEFYYIDENHNLIDTNSFSESFYLDLLLERLNNLRSYIYYNDVSEESTNFDNISLDNITNFNKSLNLLLEVNFNTNFRNVIYSKIISNKIINSDFYKSIDNSLSIIYKDNYEIKVKENSIIEIIILFPEILIKNKKGHEHKIYNLFVTFSISINSKKIITDLYGFRTKYHVTEINNRYEHSHLPDFNSLVKSIYNNTRDLPENIDILKQRFCLGAGPFGTLFNHQKVRTIDIDRFMLFLQYLKDYVSWESLSGGPYKYINAFNKFQKLKNHNISGNISINFNNYKHFNFNKNLKFINNKWVYKPDNSTKQHLIELYKNSLNHVCAVDENENYYDIFNEVDDFIDDNVLRKIELINSSKIKMFNFKGKDIYLEITAEEIKNNYNLTLKKGFYESVTKQINGIKREKDYTNYITKRKSKINNFINSIK